MQFKTERGIELELSENDIKKLMAMKGVSNGDFDFENMEKYFKDLHKHAIDKMEHISEHIITDEDSIDLAVEYVAKYGSYKDFVKMLRYARDYDIAYHILESVK